MKRGEQNSYATIGAENSKYELNSTYMKPFIGLEKEASEKRKDSNYTIIKNTELYLTGLMSLMDESQFIAILTDVNHVILVVEGDEEISKKAEKLNIIPGADIRKAEIIFNILETALNEDKPVQVDGSSDELKLFDYWNCSAAPIHDVEGNTLGVLCIVSNKTTEQINSLGFVISTSKVIENKIENELVQKQLFDAQYYAFAMMNQLSFGLFAIDVHDNIIWANDTGCRIINIKRRLLVNTSIKNIFPVWSKVKEIVNSGKLFTDEEYRFNISGLNENFLFNAYPIYSQENKIIGYQLSFRPFKRFFGLANKYAGMIAKYHFDDILYKSKKMSKVIDYAKIVARSTASVLITGESGTGKEVFAQAIHNASERRHSCFVAINCGAFSSSLIESELFGYEEGAFTGANKGGHIGKFEMANGGTLFLDEIGDMPMEMQIKLLRAIQEKQFCRVGGSDVFSVDVRIIAATNKNLEEEIKKNRFRLDLFYRINVVTINIPALRERKEDIPILAHFFLETKASKLNKPMVRLSQTLKKEIASYDWPGNIRELENYIEKITIINKPVPVVYINNTSDDTSPTIVSSHECDYTPRSLQEIEQEAIQKAIEATNANMTKVAKILGISRNTLYQKIKRYGISISKY